VSLSFPAKDPALIGRCYRQLIAPLSGPIKDQDLRVVAPVVRLSVVGAPARLAQFLEAADKVAAPEILHGVLGIFSRQGASCSGLTEDGAGTVSEPTQTFGDFLHAAGKIATPEILRGVLEIFLRQALVDALATVAMVVAMAMVVVAMVMVAMMVVVMIEDIIQETADETSRKTWQQTEHCNSPLSLGMPAPASCRRSGAC
jgi:hypothetical protein